MSTHSCGSDSRFWPSVMIVHGGQRRVQTNNVHQTVIRNWGELEVAGHAHRGGEYRGVWIVLWGQRHLSKTKHIRKSVSN